MKILMLTPYLPYPPSAGGQIRSYNLIKRLSLNHDITLACFTRETNTPNQVLHMEKFCKKVIIFRRGKAWTIPNVLRTGFSLYPFLVMIYYTPEIKQILTKEIETGQYDLIHAETFYVMPFLPKTIIPIVLVEQTIMSRVFAHEVEADPQFKWWIKPLLRIDVKKISYWERYYWKNASSLAAVSEEDAAIMRQAVPGKNVAVIPNGVGDDFEDIPKKMHYNKTLFYMGNYKWMQNWEAAKILAAEVFPLVQKKMPEVRLNIIGQFPTPSLIPYADDKIKIIELRDADRKGVVEAYQKSGLLVAPIYGPSGTRLKILAAMASMTPVVTTPIGAEGLGARDEESIMIGKTPAEIAEKTVKILSDRRLYEKIARNARKIVEKGFNWGPISERLEAVYEKTLHHHSKL